MVEGTRVHKPTLTVSGAHHDCEGCVGCGKTFFVPTGKKAQRACSATCEKTIHAKLTALTRAKVAPLNRAEKTATALATLLQHTQLEAAETTRHRFKIELVGENISPYYVVGSLMTKAFGVACHTVDDLLIGVDADVPADQRWEHTGGVRGGLMWVLSQTEPQN